MTPHQEEGSGYPAVNRGMSAEAALLAIPHWFSQFFVPSLAIFLTSDDPEGAHRTRIALRRLRAVLTSFSNIIDPKVMARIQRRCRTHFRLIGHVRDAEVLLSHVKGKRAIKKAKEDLAALRKAVRSAVLAKGIKDLPDEVSALFKGKGWRRSKSKLLRLTPIEHLSANALQRQFDTCRKTPADLGQLDEDALHEFRKKLKTLRYVTEHFGPLWPGPEQVNFLETLRSLQDVLGDLNDAKVAKAHGMVAVEPGRGALLTAQDHWMRLLQTGPWWMASAGLRT